MLRFSDTILISLSQMQKIGTILLAKPMPKIEANDPHLTRDISTLLGKDDPVTHLFARALVDHIPTDLTLILFLGLKSHIPTDVPYVVRMVEEVKIW